MTFEFGHEDKLHSIGAYLKRLREHRELSLSDVQAELKIHEKYLVAIEENDDSLFPDKVFKELFLKSYASFLGVSLEELLLRVPESVMEPPEGTPPPQRPVKVKTDIISAAAVPPMVGATEAPRRSGWQAALIVALLLLIAALVFFLFRLMHESKQPAITTPPPVVPQSEVKQEPTEIIPAVVDTTGDTVTVDTTGTADSTDSSVVVAPPEKMRMLLVGKGECWLGVRLDADTSISRIVRANDTVWLAMQDSMYLRFGRVDNVDVWFNALPLKLARNENATVFSIFIDRRNYIQYVDSARLVR